MAGKRQHFIPQLLLTGFASHQSGSSVFVWVFRKDRDPFSTNVQNVGTESYFYSDEDDREVDDRITDAESGRIAVLVQRLRSAPVGAVSGADLPELVGHLEVRTRHVRMSALTSGEQFARRILDFMAENGPYVDQLERRILSDPALLREALRKELPANGISEAKLESLIQLAKPMLPQLMPGLRAQLAIMAAQMRAQISESFAKGAKAGHLNALRAGLAPQPRVDRYACLRYSLIDVTTPVMILGDAVVLFEVIGPRAFKPFLDKDDVLQRVFVPLSPNRVLVGVKGAVTGMPADLPAEIARSSLECFIASEDTPVNRRLQRSIGENAFLISDEDMSAIIDDLLREG